MEEAHHPFRSRRIEVPRGLVHQDEGGVVRQCPGDGYILPLTCRQVPTGGPDTARVHVHEPEHPVHPAENEETVPALDLQRKGHVLVNRSVHNQLQVLEDHPDTSLEKGLVFWAAVLNVQAVDKKIALIERLQSEQQPEKKALSRAAPPQEKDEVPIAYFQIGILEDRAAMSGGLRDLKALHHGLHAG